MNGSKTMPSERGAILQAMKKPPTRGYFEWDGQDEDDRPAAPEELTAARVAYRAKIGRPPAAVKRPTLNMRIDPDVLAALRSRGKGWQTKVNALLREAVEHGRV